MLPASLHRPWLPMSFRKGMHQPTGLIDEFHEYIFGFLYESQDFQILSNQTRVMGYVWICHDISMGISYGTSEIKPTDLSGPWKTLVKSPPGHRRFRRRILNLRPSAAEAASSNTGAKDVIACARMLFY